MTHYIKSNHKKGFTLVELMIVVTVIAILATIGVISFTRVQAQTRDTKRKADVRALGTALQAYYSETQTYPAVTADLAPTYIPRIPVDPQDAGAYTYSVNSAAGTYAICAELETASASASTWKISTANAGGYNTNTTADPNCVAE